MLILVHNRLSTVYLKCRNNIVQLQLCLQITKVSIKGRLYFTTALKICSFVQNVFAEQLDKLLASNKNILLLVTLLLYG